MKPLFLRAAREIDPGREAKEGKPSAQPPARKARKRGGKATKRGLSDEQVPVLVATDRSGATVSAVLPAVNAEALRDVLAPVIDKDALLVTDGGTSYPPCAAAMGVSHEALKPVVRRTRSRGELHIQAVNNRHRPVSRRSFAAVEASPRNILPAICAGSISLPFIETQPHATAVASAMGGTIAG